MADVGALRVGRELEARGDRVAQLPRDGLPGIARERQHLRERFVQGFEELGLLEKVETYLHNVPISDRSKSPIEPLVSEQWFVKMEPLAQPAIQAVKNGALRIKPERWTKVYLDWLEKVRDWCISRQLWWGHRIPVWYDEDGTPVASLEDLEEGAPHPETGKPIVRQDEDVLDTWASSWLWPFATIGWPEQTEDLARFYPTQDMETGYDILFFWVARMIMMGLHFMDEVPFSRVLLAGLVTDENGDKMSKVKGNVIDPLDVIYGTTGEALIEKAKRSGAAEQGVEYLSKTYPDGFATNVRVSGVSGGLCGGARPGHFDGVATVCSKLFLQSGADGAFFGEKDYQQLKVVQRFVADLDIPITIHPCETVRDPDGLALSSRNQHLTPEQRAIAPAMHQAMQEAAAKIRAGEPPAAALARASERAGRHREHVEALELEVGQSEETARKVQLLHRAGEVLLDREHDLEAAQGFFRRVLELDGGHGPTLLALSRLHRGAGRWEDLLDVLERRLGKAEAPATKVELLLEMAEICLERIGREERALALFREAVALDASRHEYFEPIWLVLTTVAAMVLGGFFASFFGASTVITIRRSAVMVRLWNLAGARSRAG